MNHSYPEIEAFQQFKERNTASAKVWQSNQIVSHNLTLSTEVALKLRIG